MATGEQSVDDLKKTSTVNEDYIFQIENGGD